MSLKPSTEPVAYSTVVQTVLGALVATGWAVIPDTTINAVASAVGLVLSLVAAFVARGKVTPVKDLQALKDKAVDVLTHAVHVTGTDTGNAVTSVEGGTVPVEPTATVPDEPVNTDVAPVTPPVEVPADQDPPAQAG